jgi:hypothetical protein
MPHVKIELDLSLDDIKSTIGRSGFNDNVRLNEESLNIVRKDLLNFVNRVASSPNRTEGELAVLPAMTDLLLRQFRR